MTTTGFYGKRKSVGVWPSRRTEWNSFTSSHNTVVFKSLKILKGNICSSSGWITREMGRPSTPSLMAAIIFGCCVVFLLLDSSFLTLPHRMWDTSLLNRLMSFETDSLYFRNSFGNRFLIVENHTDQMPEDMALIDNEIPSATGEKFKFPTLKSKGIPFHWLRQSQTNRSVKIYLTNNAFCAGLWRRPAITRRERWPSKTRGASDVIFCYSWALLKVQNKYSNNNSQ